MQITLNLDESLLKEAFQLTNLTTQEELMNLALQELGLFGTWYGSIWGHKSTKSLSSKEFN
jgi:hypothetical protein